MCRFWIGVIEGNENFLLLGSFKNRASSGFLVLVSNRKSILGPRE
jgi:hypothetical protein